MMKLTHDQAKHLLDIKRKIESFRYDFKKFSECFFPKSKDSDSSFHKYVFHTHSLVAFRIDWINQKFSSEKEANKVLQGIDCLLYGTDLSSFTHRGYRECLLAWRGGGKTTSWLRESLIFHAAYGRYKHAHIIKSKLEFGNDDIEKILSLIKESDDLLSYFPHLDGVIRKDEGYFSELFCISIGGFKGASRGLNKSDYGRPTIIMPDDLDKDKEQGNPELRKENLQVFLASMARLGESDESHDILCSGTKSHEGSTYAMLCDSIGYNFASFPLVSSWPSNNKVLEEFRQFYLSCWRKQKLFSRKGKPLEQNYARKQAESYFENHPELMEGYEISWPSGSNHLDILLSRFEDPDSFFQEMQHEAISEENRVFKDFKVSSLCPKISSVLGCVSNSIEDQSVYTFAVFGMDEEEKIYLLDYHTGEFDLEEFGNFLVRSATRYYCQTFLCLDDQYEDIFKDGLEFLYEENEDIDFSFMFETFSLQNKKEKNFIRRLKREIKNFVFLEEYQDFIDDLKYYPKSKHLSPAFVCALVAKNKDLFQSTEIYEEAFGDGFDSIVQSFKEIDSSSVGVS